MAAPEAAAEATKTADGCKKAIAELASKPAALKALPKDRLDRLVQGRSAVGPITCLAVAKGERAYCDVLPDQSKQQCLAGYEQVIGLKGLPKEKLKGRVLRDLCLHGQMCDHCDKAECDKIEEAVNTGEPAKCAGLADAVHAFCVALATPDASKCTAVPEGEGRNVCKALATEDASHCAPDSTDCRSMANAFAAFRKQGLAGVQGIDPSVAAGAQGMAACQPLLADFEKTCVEGK